MSAPSPSASEISPRAAPRPASWRPQSAPRPGARMVRRFAVTVLALLLLAALVLLLLAPYQHPRTSIVLFSETGVSAGTREDRSTLLIPPGIGSTAAALDDLQPMLLGPGPIVIKNAASPDGRPALSAALDRLAGEQLDVLVVMISGTGCVEGGRGYLGWQQGPAASPARRIEIVDLLKQLGAHPARTRLLILDSGTPKCDARNGVLVSEFPRLLAREVERLGTDGLWVLHSHSALEESQASAVLGRSVFADFAVRALSGAADANRDRFIDLDELTRYVSTGVAAWVRETSAGAATQTPALLHHGGARVRTGQMPVLLAAASPPSNRRDGHLIDFREMAASAGKASTAAAQIPGAAPLAGKVAPPAAPPIVAQSREAAAKVRSVATADATKAPASPAATSTAPAGSSDAATKTAPTQPTAAAPADPAAPSGAKASPSGGPAESAAAAQSPSASSGGNASSPDDLPLDEPPPDAAALALLIAEGWELRDRLESQSDGPLTYAPQHWRALQQRLLHDERLVRFGAAIDPLDFATALRRRNAALRWLADSAAPPPRIIPPELAALVAARPQQSDPQPLETFAAVESRIHAGIAVADPVREAIVMFDQTLLADSGDAFRTWLTQLPADFDRYSEIRFARRLLASRVGDWNTLQTALRCRRRAGQMTALASHGTEWIAPAVESADRTRLAAERLLLDEIGGDREPRAAALFDRALLSYDAAARDAGDVDAASRTARLLIHRLPWYLEWHARARLARAPYRPESRTLEDLIATLTSLIRRLDRPDPRQLPELRALHARLELLWQTIETPFDAQHIGELATAPLAIGDAWRIELLLSTPLPRADVRQSLLAAAVPVETELLDRIRISSLEHRAPDAMDPGWSDWDFLATHLRLEQLATALAPASDSIVPAAENPLASSLLEFENALKALEASGNFHSSNEPVWRALDAASSELRRRWQSIPARIDRTLARPSNAGTGVPSHNRLNALRDASRLLDVAGSAVETDASRTVPLRLQQAIVHQSLAFEARRVEIALSDVPAADRPSLLSRLDRLRDALAAIPDQPPVPPGAGSPLEIHGPADVSLVVDEVRTVPVTFTSRTTDPLPVWLIVDYDTEHLEVTSLPEFPVFVQDAVAADLRRRADAERFQLLQQPGEDLTPEERTRRDEQRAQAERAAQYPYRPDLASLSPTLRLQGNEPRTVVLTVRRKSESPWPARLVVKAVAANTCVRHETAVELPSSASLELEVAGGAGTWSNDRGVVLYPFPNRGTDYRFRLVNPQAIDRTVDVELLAPATSPSVPLPEAALTSEEADRLLESFGDASVVGRYPKIALPASSRIAIPFAPSPPPGAPAAPKAVGPEAPPPTPLPHGLLFVMTDQATGRKTVRRVTIEPQRPRRYVRPRVGYNPDREQIEITVAPVHPDLLPPGGAHVRCDVAEPLPEREAQREGVVFPDREARLFIAVTPEAGKVVTLRLTVDDYPRAFLYRVPCKARSIDLPEETGVLEARVISPVDGAAWLAPVAGIPAVIEIDAPPGTFGNGGDSVEIGLDRDRDRDLVGDSPLRFSLDRQLRIGLEPPGPEGRLTIVSDVGDFELNIPSPGLTNARVGVLARVVAGRQSAWSRSPEVVFDAAPPRVLSVGLGRERTITAGTILDVTALCTDDGLSGVARVEVGLDVARTGEFGEGNKPLPAALDSEGRWTAKIPTAPLTSGTWTLLTRGVDHVGNISPTTRTTFQVISAEEAKAAAAAATNVVKGTVLYGKDPIPDVQVEIELADGKKVDPVATDARGEFTFPKVPVGKGTLKAARIVRNNRRKGTAEVEVLPPPAKVPAIRIELR